MGRGAGKGGERLVNKEETCTRHRPALEGKISWDEVRDRDEDSHGDKSLALYYWRCLEP
jgi:hypothetical protein